MSDFVHVRRQYGVGQGSFHSAFVETNIGNQQYRFDYVYDCGATEVGRQTVALKRALKSYRPGYRHESGAERHVIDALVLSHFDRDHMNGAAELAATFHVERIYVPYLAPETLVLEIARQASGMTLELLENLFSVANGGGLWGVEVTRVRGGPTGPGPDENRSLDRDTPPFLEGSEEQPDNTIQGGIKSLRAVLAKTNQPVGKLIDHDEDIRLEGNGKQVWQLRFWNHDADDLLVLYVLTLLDEVGFPIEALEEANGAVKVMEWLESKDNRDAAVEAYLVAIQKYQGTKFEKAIEDNIANYISLAMFSAPPSNLRCHLEYRFRASESRYWHPYGWDVRSEAGWLGTGDAMLGESSIWNSFRHHFRAELKQISTVLLPHHGAAPLKGPKFYNPGLNPSPGILSVLSAGKNNTYGHPSTEVLDAVIKQHGDYIVVSEDTWPGFEEHIRPYD